MEIPRREFELRCAVAGWPMDAHGEISEGKIIHHPGRDSWDNLPYGGAPKCDVNVGEQKP